MEQGTHKYMSRCFQHIMERADEMLNNLIATRRDLHAHPEIRFQEVRTAKIVEEHIGNLGIRVQRGMAKTGVVGFLTGGLGKGKVLGIRCDMDALPIQEKSTVPYRSQTDGAMHACGHDVHTTIGIGIAKVLAAMKNQFRGSVKFIFQPSEENPFGDRGGALAMIDEGVLQNPPLDAVLSLHCWPDLNVGQVGVGAGPAMAAMVAFNIDVSGKQAHAAAPHLGSDSMLGAAQTITSLYHIVSRRTDPADSYALAVNEIAGGKRHSIVGTSVSMAGTVRAVSKESLFYVMDLMKDTVDGISRMLDIEIKLIFDEITPAVVNDSHLDQIVSGVATSILGKENVILQKKCPMTAEDFSYMTDRVPGYYLKLGVSNEEKGIRYALHNDRFDVDERCIAVGVSVLASAALEFLKE